MKKILSILVLTLMLPLLLANTVPTTPAIPTKSYNELSDKWVKDGDYYYLNDNLLDSTLWEYNISIDLPSYAVIEYRNNLSKAILGGTANEWTRIQPYQHNTEIFNKLNLQIIYSEDWGGYFTDDTGVTYFPGETTLEFRYFHAVITNPEVTTTVDDLPVTQEGILANVYFVVNGYEVTMTIWISGTPYTLTYTFDEETDMTMFNTIEAYFIKRNNKPQIYINLSTDRVYLRDILNASNDTKPVFVPHVIWDLKTNNIQRVEKYDAYAYMKQNAEGVMIAYYYVDSFIMDNVLSTTLTYTSREHQVNWMGLVNQYTPWDTKQWIHTSDSIIEYRNLTANWQLFIPIYGLVFTNIRTNTYYQMPAIKALDFNNLDSEYNITKTELEMQYASIDSSFTVLKNNPRYKVWAFALQEGKNVDAGLFGKVQTEIYHNPNNPNDPYNLKVIEIVYATDEKLYTTVGKDMNLHIKLDPKIDGIANETKEQINAFFIAVISFAVFLIIGLFTKSLMFRNKVNFAYIFVALGLSTLIYYILQNIGTIKIGF